MPFLICDKCNIYYEIDDMEEKKSLDHCECGSTLKYSENLDDYSEPDSGKTQYKKPIRESISVGSSYTETLGLNYKYGMIVGFIFEIIGLSGALIGNPLFIIMALVGVGILYYSYYESKSRFKDVKGENMVLNYLNRLPEGYFIFNKVKIPKKQINIDHIVIGPTGIFVVETKNLGGSYIVDGNQWFFYNKGRTKKIFKNPGYQLKQNTTDLKRYLAYNGVSTTKLWINSVLAYLNKDIEIINKPEYYNILHPSQLTDFIKSKDNTLDIENLKKSVFLIEQHSVEMSYVKPE
jgi:thioredoxin-related protein